METTRLVRVIEEDTVLFHARRVEVVGGTAQRHDQGVVRQLALRNQQLPFFITQFCQSDGFAFTVDVHHRAQLELEMMVARVCQIAERVHALVQRAGRYFVQQRFPQVAVVTIHQRDFGFFTAPQLLTQLCRQLQPASTTAYNHYLFQWRSQRDPLKLLTNC